jgi:hypothetical protein
VFALGKTMAFLREQELAPLFKLRSTGLDRWVRVERECIVAEHAERLSTGEIARLLREQRGDTPSMPLGATPSTQFEGPGRGGETEKASSEQAAAHEEQLGTRDVGGLLRTPPAASPSMPPGATPCTQWKGRRRGDAAESSLGFVVEAVHVEEAIEAALTETVALVLQTAAEPFPGEAVGTEPSDFPADTHASAHGEGREGLGAPGEVAEPFSGAAVEAVVPAPGGAVETGPREAVDAAPSDPPADSPLSPCAPSYQEAIDAPHQAIASSLVKAAEAGLSAAVTAVPSDPPPDRPLPPCAPSLHEAIGAPHEAIASSPVKAAKAGLRDALEAAPSDPPADLPLPPRASAGAACVCERGRGCGASGVGVEAAREEANDTGQGEALKATPADPPADPPLPPCAPSRTACVYVSESARTCDEVPGKRRGMSYHVRPGCYNSWKKTTVRDAEAYGHVRCDRCAAG